MSRVIIFLVALSVVAIIATAATTNVVPKLDLNRYLGEWYEIARFENRFEKDLINVTAHYSLHPDGSIKVVNRGFNTQTKEWSEAIGRAKRTNEEGRLRVSFFWIFYSDYNIISLDPQYQWALVGSGKKYLWILSRSRNLSPQTLNHIKQIAQQNGYNTKRLIYP